MIDKENKKVDEGKRNIRRGASATNKVKKFKQTPFYRTSGNVTMATNGRVYKFPNPFGAKQVMFFGIAVRYAVPGYTLNTNSVAVVPAKGAIYEYDDDDKTVKIVITGSSSSTVIFALPLKGTIKNGRYNKVSGTGDSFIQVNSFSAPGVDIRADVFGVAQLTPSYYFTPLYNDEVGLAGPKQKIIQGGKWFLIVDENATGETPEYRARATETTLVNIDWPTSSTIVVKAEVTDYSQDYFEVTVALAPNWELSGNFMCT